MFGVEPKIGFVVTEKVLRKRKVKYLVKDSNRKSSMYMDETSCDSTATQSSSTSIQSCNDCDSNYFSCASTDLSFSSTSTQLNFEEIKTPKSKGRKPRRRTFKPTIVEEEEGFLSDYEMQREKKILENAEMLKLIFLESGLEFGNYKEQAKPEKRKKYIRSPLPPPRPKSLRLKTKERDFDFVQFPCFGRNSCPGINMA